jgi:hypothetical protein
MSGSGSQNILFIANSTPEDNCVLTTSSNQPCALRGYVQGYTLISSGGAQQWTQSISPGSSAFQYRYIGQLGDHNIYGGKDILGGFGNSVSVVKGHLLIGQGLPDSLPANVNPCKFLIFLVETRTPNTAESGFLAPINTLNPTAFTPSPFPMTPMYPDLTAQGRRYNQGVQLLPDGSNQLLAVSWYAPDPVNNICIVDLAGTGTNDPFTNFELVQSLGATFDSQSVTSLQVAYYGFAQFTTTWVSRTGNTIRLIMNDPAYKENQGRIILLTRKRQ